MATIVPRAVIGALALVGGLSLAAPAFADTPAFRGVSCVQAGWASDRVGCRTTSHRRALRSDFARVRAPGPALVPYAPFAGRYVSLLVLGVGY